MTRALLLSSALALLGAGWSWAKDEPTVSDSDEAFEQVRHLQDQGTEGTDIESVLQSYAHGGEVNEGTYAPSELWDQHFDLRRVKPAQISANGQLFFKYSNDHESGLEKWEKELELNLDYTDWSGYFRFSDVNSFPNIDVPFRWEKGRIRYRGTGVAATVGSFAQVFGRGLAVNLYEDRFLEFDNEVEGAKVDVDLGQGTSLTALWGSRKALADPRDSEIGAAHLEAPVDRHLTLGTTVAEVRFPDPDYTAADPRAYDYSVIGGNATLHSGQFNLFTEGVRLEHEKLEYGNDWDRTGSPGTGYYVDASISGKGYALSAEYKDYDGIQQPFSVLPPIRLWSKEATATPNDDKGYGFHCILSPAKDGSSVAVNYVQDNAHDKGFPYTEFSVIYTSPARGSTTWVAEYWDIYNRGESHAIDRLTLNHRITSDWTASTYLSRERINLGYVNPFSDYIVEGEFSYQSKANLVYTWETTKEKDALESAWGLWELKLKPDEEQELNLMYGSRRAGVVCSGGVCRLEPAFEGFRADYLFRF